MLRREVGNEVRLDVEVSNAARSAIRRPGLLSMVPRREMRRPAWSELRRRVSLNLGMSDSTWAAISGGVVEVMVAVIVGEEKFASSVLQDDSSPVSVSED